MYPGILDGRYLDFPILVVINMIKQSITNESNTIQCDFNILFILISSESLSTPVEEVNGTVLKIDEK